MPNVTLQKLLLIAFVVVFSAFALGKSPFAAFPGGPASATDAKVEARPAARYGWFPPKRTKGDAEVYANGEPLYGSPAIATMHHPWDLDVDY